MRYAAAAYHLLLVNDQTDGDARDAEHARNLQLAREASRTPSFRRRAGEAVIALGVRLAGDYRSMPDERRLTTRPT